MFGLSGGELITLLVIGMVLMGPSRLPQTARQAAIFIKKIRAITAGATAELREVLGPGFEEIDLTDLNPKTLIKKQIVDVVDDHVKALNEPLVDRDGSVLNTSGEKQSAENVVNDNLSASMPAQVINDFNNLPPTQIDPDLL